LDIIQKIQSSELAGSFPAMGLDRTSKHIGVTDECFDSTFRRCSRRFGERQLMEPMKPMTRMAPMRASERWWPDDMGSASTSGSQNGMRYAFFRDKRRLMVERDGHLTTYETGDHDIGGVSQADTGSRSVQFTSQHGPVNLSELKLVD
jgi:hypothetical protein